MDINLLSKMVGELILDNERVALPGIGSFVALDMPASFSDRGYTINPPYRKLTIVSDTEDDGLLSQLYASSNDIDVESARLILEKYINSVHEDLLYNKTVLFPGLGKLRLTNEGNLFFVEDENLDIYTEGFGLQPISLKANSGLEWPVGEPVAALGTTSEQSGGEESIAAVSGTAIAADMAAEAASLIPEPQEEAGTENLPLSLEESGQENLPEPQEEVAPLAETAQEPAPEPAPAPATQPEPEPETQPEPESKQDEKASYNSALAFRAYSSGKQTLGVGAKIAIGVLATVFVALALIAVVGRLAPDFIDKILYTPEEIRIINF